MIILSGSNVICEVIMTKSMKAYNAKLPFILDLIYHISKKFFI